MCGIEGSGIGESTVILSYDWIRIVDYWQFDSIPLGLPIPSNCDSCHPLPNCKISKSPLDLYHATQEWNSHTCTLPMATSFLMLEYAMCSYILSIMGCQGHGVMLYRRIMKQSLLSHQQHVLKSALYKTQLLGTSWLVCAFAIQHHLLVITWVPSLSLGRT